MRKTVLGTQYSVLSFLLVLVGVTLSPAQQGNHTQAGAPAGTSGERGDAGFAITAV